MFNDGQFDDVTKKQARDEMMINLVHGEPITFGAEQQRGVVMGNDGQLRLVELADVSPDDVLVHDAHRARSVAGVRARPAEPPTTTPPHRSVCSAASNAPSTRAPSPIR